MKRKIVKQGAATLMVSLPAKWARQHGLKKGHEVDIEENGKELIISLEGKAEKKVTEINVSSEIESAVRTIVTSAYRLGYDTVKVNVHSKEALRKVKEVVESKLLGFEIIEEDENGCVIENITEPSFEQFDNIFGKVFLNIEMLFGMCERMINGEREEFKSVEKKILEFDNFCRRVIVKEKPMENVQLQWDFHISIDRGQRELFHMLEFLERNMVKNKREMVSLLNKVRAIFDIVKKTYYEKDVALIEAVHEKEKQLIYKDGYNLLNKGKDAIVVHHLMAAARHFYLASSPLTGVLISLEKN